MGRYLGDRRGEAFDPVFDFDFLFAGWDAGRLRASVDRAEALLPEHGWPCRALSSHDVSRHVSRFGADAARAAALVLLTLRGTPVIYIASHRLAGWLTFAEAPRPRRRVRSPRRR